MQCPATQPIVEDEQPPVSHPEALKWCFAIDAADVPDGEAMPAVVNGQAIAIFHIKEAFFATDDTCTHGAASLSEGYVDGDVVECPLHQGLFCIRTGQPKGGPVKVALRTYETRVEDGRVMVLSA